MAKTAEKKKMRLLRPYIPLSVRVAVIASQIQERRPDIMCDLTPSKANLKILLHWFFGDRNVQLDHDPALQNRIKYVDDNGRIIGYFPNANHPLYLIYRTTEDHKTKTLVRGDGALRSDVSQRRYLNKVAVNRGLRKKKPSRKIANRKTKWPSRPFPNKHGG